MRPGQTVPLKGWTVIDALAQLGKALKAGLVAGLYLLVGEDVFTREQACRMIAEAAAALAPGGLERTVLYGDEATPELIMTAIGTGSLFGDQRLVVVRGFDRLPAAGQDQLVPLLTNLPAGVTAVLICAALDRKRKAMQALIRAARLVACDPPQQGALPQWIIQRARELGFAIQPEAVQVLLELAGSDLQALYTELEKLAFTGLASPWTRRWCTRWPAWPFPMRRSTRSSASPTRWLRAGPKTRWPSSMTCWLWGSPPWSS